MLDGVISRYDYVFGSLLGERVIKKNGNYINTIQ